MSNFIEAIANSSNSVREFSQKYQYGLLDRADKFQYLNTATNNLVMQAEHIENTSRAIADEAQKLLDSLCAQRK